MSEKGREAYEHHARFHRAMIESVSDGLNQEELEMLVRTLTKLNRWFRSWQDH